MGEVGAEVPWHPTKDRQEVLYEAHQNSLKKETTHMKTTTTLEYPNSTTAINLLHSGITLPSSVWGSDKTAALARLEAWLQAAQKERLELDPTYLRKIRELAVGELRNVSNSAKVRALGIRV